MLVQERGICHKAEITAASSGSGLSYSILIASCVAHKSKARVTYMGKVGKLECLERRLFGHILPPLSEINETSSMGGLSAADCLLYGCARVYSVTETALKCIWGYATVLEVILNAVILLHCGFPSVFSLHVKECHRGANMAFRTRPCKLRWVVQGAVLEKSLFQYLWSQISPGPLCLLPSLTNRCPWWTSATTCGTFQADRCAFCRKSMFHICRASWWGS